MYNKKHTGIVVSIAITAVMFGIAGCGRDRTENGATAGTTTAEAEVIASGDVDNSQVDGENAEWEPAYDEGETAPDGLPLLTGTYDLTECITLCDYDGMTVEYDGKPDVTYEDAKLRCMFQEDAKMQEDGSTDVKKGDYVTMDITASTDGEEISDLSWKEYSENVGSGDMDTRLETAIIGKRTGSEAHASIEYPDDYDYEAVAGKKVDYAIEITSIARPAEPKDEDVEAMLADMQENRDYENSQAMYSAVRTALIEKSTYKAYPEKLIRQLRSSYEKGFINGYDTLNDYLDQAGITKSEFKSDEDTYATQAAKEELMYTALGDRTGITKESDEYKEKVAEIGADSDDPDEPLHEAMLDEALKSIKTINMAGQ